MTRTVLFAGQASSTTSSKRAAPAASRVRKTLDAVYFLMFGASPRVFAKVAQPYPWLPAHIRSNMSPRAQRLMRSDY
ncbi:hypothetical protein [Polaromonas sp. SM01]|uniref:hypothetical protein n=1 Tax=Polaromonas sp. SM01 TaxID=3085630 RepID=UPI0029825662|nr:hypothetical protein [Polaromonas sp. SM01]MDW5443280.1 hypothetical protein [Polaromonas sp. SM01]